MATALATKKIRRKRAPIEIRPVRPRVQLGSEKCLRGEMPQRVKDDFIRMLKRLRRDLNNPAKVEQMLDHQVRWIVLRDIRWHFDTSTGEIVFPRDVPTRRYLSGKEMPKDWVHGRWNRQRCRQQLEMLRDFLNDDRCRRFLALVGPVKFFLDFETYSEFGCEGKGPLIENYLAPGIIPNADWSIAIDGRLYFHS